MRKHGLAGVVDRIKTEERRVAAGVPLRFQLIDGLGVLLGGWFIAETLRRPDPSWINVGLGAVMVYIHSERFFYAPQVKMLIEEREKHGN